MSGRVSSNRREFLAGSAAMGVLAMTGAARGETPASERLRIGVVGVGWYGMVDAMAALEVGGVEIAAVCDVDSEHLEAAASKLEKETGKRPATFKLYDDMLAKCDLDVMIIGSPPQWHALHLLGALEAGLDVYCEKPLAYDIREGRAMVDAVNASGKVVQVGFQRRQSESFRQAAEYVKSGAAGELIQVDAQIHYRAGIGDATPQDPPACLDWDLWCGPGPKIPYSPQVSHKSWRLEMTSGHGHLVDWGIHLIDSTRMMLDLPMPREVTAVGGIYNEKYRGVITTPDTLTAAFDFGKVPVVWRHRLWGSTEYSPETNNGIFLYCENATVFANDQKWTVIPAGRGKEHEVHEAGCDLKTLHMANFLSAVREGTPLACPIEDGYKSTATVQLAMISQETGSVVRWDESKEEIVDNAAGASLLNREYRAPYEHPWKG